MPSLPRLSGVSEGSYTSSVWSKVVACSTIFKLLNISYRLSVIGYQLKKRLELPESRFKWLLITNNYFS